MHKCYLFCASRHQHSPYAREHAQLSNKGHSKTQLNVPHGQNNQDTDPYIQKLPWIINRTEWMKGICHVWSRGRHFSPSLPGNRYLKLGSQKRSPGRNLGEHRLVRRSSTASRGTALSAFCLRMRSFPTSEGLTIFMETVSAQRSNTASFSHASFFNMWMKL